VEKAYQLWTHWRLHMNKAMAHPQIREDFDRFSFFIRRKQTLELTRAFVNALFDSDIDAALGADNYKLTRAAAQEVCVSFMIAEFPQDVLNTKTPEMKDDDPDNECWQCARRLSKVLMCNDDETCHVIADVVDPAALAVARDCYTKFVSTFTSWKEYDRNRLMESLAMCHQQWHMTQQAIEKEEKYDPATVEEWKTELLKQKAQIRRRMMQMGGKEWTERLLAREPTVIDIDQIILEKGQEKYWDDFAVELSSNPPRFDRLMTLLLEIRERLVRLVPNSKAFHDKLKAELDLDLIKQMIDNNVFDYQSFVQTFDSIWGTISSLQAAEDDAEWKAWRVAMEERFVAASSDNSGTWALLLPPIFNRVLMQIDRLEDKVAAARQAMADAKQRAREERDGLLPKQPTPPRGEDEMKED